MSVETIRHTSPHSAVETTPEREQPLVTPDATAFEQHEDSYAASQRDIFYLSSAAILAHEHARIAELTDEAIALQDEIRLVVAELTRIANDLRYVDEQVSDLGYFGAPQLRMRKQLQEEQTAATALKELLEAKHYQKTENITALKAHQERREWALQHPDY